MPVSEERLFEAKCSRISYGMRFIEHGPDSDWHYANPGAS